MILADTSVWIEYLRHGNARFSAVLESDQVLMHPFVIGELACGNRRNRKELLALWSSLWRVPGATDVEALAFIDLDRLMGSGLGYIDVHLLVSTALTGAARLWTHDRQLASAAAKLNLAHDHLR